MITQLASWKAGGIAVCLNPMLKERELTYHIKDSGLTILVCLESLYEEVVSKIRNQVPVPVVITTNELLYLSKRIPDMLKGVVSRRFTSCHDYSQLIRVHSGQSLSIPSLNLDDTAMLTYTSGTTGVPKGACNTHRNIVFNGLSVTNWVHLGDNDIVMAPAPLFHITGSITGPAAGYASGCPVILFCRFDPSEFLRLIDHWKVTYLVGAITVFIAALSHPDIQKYNLSSVTKMYSGGAPVSAAIQKQVERAFGNKLYVAYGLTESTAPCTAVPHGVDAPVDPNYGALSIGVPTCNVDCRIVSAETGKDVPEGTPGELLIKGPQVVSGYWNKPEETAKAIKNGWLHTGDVAIIDSRGYLYIVDRIKDMIIASGFKVYPREVEDVLYEHRAVKEAAVIGVPDPYRGETVKAFVALKEGMKVSEKELVEFCKRKLAAYKYPRQIEFLPEIPKTLSGKFLRRELRDLELKRHPKAGDNIPNGTIRSKA
ncbi:long-chain acyl-CoA synthetase [Galdieria sulphuraria]|uniref:Long-chain acyl-CoA synthetase n=1 Tax=Galdieria sulphuraria TaxID=130081 RepID=M2Y8J1_GALSU|nr:long-chain acyl-CoA synthetase [Galdieria sulphuraria]EME32164.1 long-chain acyl-CoA synthetase [Galdieria sulphuraria]|eukprot:XP_005708684.1 long-chain acyl-CoA synthetase [Galdieria sulphuraria]